MFVLDSEHTCASASHDDAFGVSFATLIKIRFSIARNYQLPFLYKIPRHTGTIATILKATRVHCTHRVRHLCTYTRIHTYADGYVAGNTSD